MALEAEAIDQVVHPVEAAQHGALAAARRADEAGDLALLDRHMAVAHGQEVAVEDLVDLAVDSRRRCSWLRVSGVGARGMVERHGIPLFPYSRPWAGRPGG